MRRFWVCEDSRNAHVEVFIKSKYKELGPMKFKEYAVMFYFLLLIVIWFFAEPNFIEGWSDWFKSPSGGETVSEATPAIFILILILITPEHMSFWPFIDEVKFYSMHKSCLLSTKCSGNFRENPISRTNNGLENSLAGIYPIFNIRKVDPKFYHLVYPLGPVDSPRCWICSRKGLG